MKINQTWLLIAMVFSCIKLVNAGEKNKNKVSSNKTSKNAAIAQPISTTNPSSADITTVASNFGAIVSTLTPEQINSLNITSTQFSWVLAQFLNGQMEPNVVQGINAMNLTSKQIASFFQTNPTNYFYTLNNSIYKLTSQQIQAMQPTQQQITLANTAQKQALQQMNNMPIDVVY